MALPREEIRQAVMHLERGDWQAAHAIAQRDEAGELACWAHGIVHLMEGDAANARYWYRAAGRAFPEAPSLAAELAALRERLAP
ncbi:MAG TPA: hypothetical protein VFV74_08215 [Burkholderiales bacterium]|nr:hypothetical protein [Burkholderiales bacterium]